MKEMKTHKDLGRKISDYVIPTYIEDLEKEGRIKILESKFIGTNLFHIDLTNNIVRRFIDGHKSEEVKTRFLNSFNDVGWNPHKGPICVVIKELVDNEIKYRPLGYTHRAGATVDSNISDIPSLVISIVNDADPITKKEAIVDLYTLEQSYERAIQYDETQADVFLTLNQWKDIYVQRYPNWQTQSITKIEDYLENKIVKMWGKYVTEAMKKRISTLLGNKSTYSVTDYSTSVIATNFFTHKYNGNFVWNGIGKITKNITFNVRNREKTPAIQIVENDNTLYKSIFIYDNESNSGWVTTYNMLIQLYEDNSDSKLMVFFGIGGGSIPTNNTVDSRRNTWISQWDMWVKHLPSHLKSYLHIGGWLASDTDLDKNSILDYNEVKRNN